MPESSPAQASPWRLWVAAAAVCVWIAFLAQQAMTSARPLVVSRPQVLAADAIVEGNLPPDRSRIEVTKVWYGDAALVGRKVPIAARGGLSGTVIAPLSRLRDDRFHVTPTTAETSPIYPSNAAVMRQFENLLQFRRDLEQREPTGKTQ